MSCCPHTLACLLRLADLDMRVVVSTAVALEAGILCTVLQVVAYCYFAIRSKVRDTSAMCVNNALSLDNALKPCTASYFLLQT